MKIRFPGFIDLQVNGFSGVDYNTPGLSQEEIEKSFVAMRKTGVTQCLPTLITSSFESFSKCAQVLTSFHHKMNVGLHIEGPYISPLDGARGAHPLAYVIVASIEDFKRRQEAANGRILLVTLAPEVAGALALTEYLVAQNIRVAIGHTLANAAQIMDAVSAGATSSTHLGNGCPQMMPRHENVIWNQLANDALTACLIADGHHLPPNVVKSLIRAKGLARTVLVTDAVAAAGAPPGRYRLGDLEVVRNEEARVTAVEKNQLAGSALTLDVAVANTAKYCQLPLEEILPLAHVNAGKLIGIDPAGMVEAEWNPTEYQLRILTVNEGESD